MARTTLRGKAPPQRKKTSSTLSKGKASSTGQANAPSAGSNARGAVTKAAKRASFRASLMAGKAEEFPIPKNVGPGQGDTISRSALRRRKRRAREALAADEAAGRRGGVQDVQDALKDVEDEIEMEDEAAEEEQQQQQVKGVGAPQARPQRVSEKMRKRVLIEEQARQKTITSDAAFRANPFQALRAHAQTSLALEPKR
ncbi:hypothetical protein CBOM_03942 [Ceraceosorus bombacis]|uniref:Ribosome biogenesis protein SLX9 n=1 Tax=Ceraceosorus bombacis TaxID=401625 RepID=A0A0P1BMY2_9BASI|nr:hypothetical protein CBOM_03942 [Ceraceosorus bombacis]